MIKERVANVSPQMVARQTAAPSSSIMMTEPVGSHVNHSLPFRYLRISRRYLIVSRIGRILLC
jgi:hypothetical protein